MNIEKTETIFSWLGEMTFSLVLNDFGEEQALLNFWSKCSDDLESEFETYVKAQDPNLTVSEIHLWPDHDESRLILTVGIEGFYSQSDARDFWNYLDDFLSDLASRFSVGNDEVTDG